MKKIILVITFFGIFTTLTSCKSAIENRIIAPGVWDLRAEHARVGPGLVTREWASIWGLPDRNWLPAQSLGANQFALEAGSLQSAYLGATQFCNNQNRQMNQKQAVPGGFLDRASIIFECR
jgi:hypothetical protein